MIEQAFLFDVEGATEIWLVRHADCYQGLTDADDPPLSPRGIEQAERLAARLRRIGFDGIYSSPMRRALETAEHIGGEVEIDPRLVEISMDANAFAAGTAINRWVGFNEPADQVIARMRGAVEDAVHAHPGGRVVMVSHGGAILGYLTDVLRLEFGRLRLLPYYTSVSVVRVLGDRRMAGALADVAHLEGA